MNGVDKISPPEEEEETVSFAELMRKKESSSSVKDKDDEEKPKKKKKKKSKKEKGLIPLGADPITYTDKDGKVVEVDIPDSAFVDFYESDEEEDDDSTFVDRIVDPNRAAYKKLKKDSNKYKREVAEELTLLYDLLSETDKFSKSLSKRYTETVNNRKSGGVTKYSVDLATAVLSSKQNKLAIIKEISNIKKAVIDLKLKAEAQEAKLKAMSGEKDDVDMGLVGSSYLQSVINYGRKNFTDTVAGDNSDYGSYEYEDEVEADDDAFASYDEDEQERLEDFAMSAKDQDYDELIAQRLKSKDGYSFRRTDSGNKYIQYENREVTVKIAYDSEANDYHFFAEDRDGEIIDDYPLPNPDKEVNPIKFSQDMRHGTDRLGRVFKVVNF